MDLEGICKLNESNMEGQVMLHLKALMRKTDQDASSAHGGEGIFNLSNLKVLALLKNLV
jgi:hypothetical protein